jgi:hypothetical protein
LKIKNNRNLIEQGKDENPKPHKNHYKKETQLLPNTTATFTQENTTHYTRAVHHTKTQCTSQNKEMYIRQKHDVHHKNNRKREMD